MSEERMTEEEARANLRDAIVDWYATSFDGRAVVTGWVLTAKGTGWDDEGSSLAHLALDWHGDIIDQIGLTEYARLRTHARLEEESR